jgi:signal transduction histidine kinase
MAINWLQRHPRIVDWALVLFALVTTVGAATRHGGIAVGIPIAVIVCLPLLWRRRYPVAVLGAMVAPTVAIVAVGGGYNPIPVGVALFTVASECDRRTSLRAGALALAVLAVPLWARAGWGNGWRLLGELIGFAVAWLIGDSVRSRRRYTEALEERAERLERERETEAARAVAEEQARIGRELHDVIAHSLSVIVVQAAAARDVFATRPERADEALANIETTGRGALGELRRLLGGIRGDAPFAPQPGLADLDELVGQVRGAGLDVHVAIDGQQTPLPPAIDLSVYRVVQEALTNTLKHAHASRAEVALRYAAGELDLEIRDNGTPTGNGGETGNGLIGMRERVALFGGSFAAGPRPDGGFAVSARFPLAEASE